MSTKNFHRIVDNLKFLNNEIFEKDQLKIKIPKNFNLQEHFLSLFEIVQGLGRNFPNLTVNDLTNKDFYELGETERFKIFFKQNIGVTSNMGLRQIPCYSTIISGNFGEKTELPPLTLPIRILENHSLGDYGAFLVEGFSMLPVEPGNVVVAEKLYDKDDFEEGIRYIVVLNDSIVFKRVYKGKTFEQNKSLTLESDNKEFAPFDVNGELIYELWRPHKIIINA